MTSFIEPGRQPLAMYENIWRCIATQYKPEFEDLNLKYANHEGIAW